MLQYIEYYIYMSDNKNIILIYVGIQYILQLHDFMEKSTFICENIQKENRFHTLTADQAIYISVYVCIYNSIIKTQYII